MKRIVAALLVVLTSGALAVDAEAFKASSGFLMRSLSVEVGKTTSIYTQNLPGYGVQILVLFSSGAAKPDVAVERLRALVSLVLPSIKGIDQGEWLSITVRQISSFEVSCELTVRVKQAKGSPVEVWLNGVKQ